MYLFLSAATLLHFHCCLPRLWEHEEPPDDPNEVEDPLYRAISKFRVNWLGCRKGRGCGCCEHPIMGRERGEFVRQEDDVAEPMRTERLLLKPFTLFHSNATDAYDGAKLVWLSRARGDTLLNIFFHWLAYVNQLVIAALSGVGPFLSYRSTEAYAQVVIIMSLQFIFAFWTKFSGPAADRIEGAARPPRSPHRR